MTGSSVRAAVVVLAVLALAGCGEGDEPAGSDAGVSRAPATEEPGASTAPAEQPSPDPAPSPSAVAQAGAPAVVQVLNNEFSPKVLKVRVGKPVVFANGDGVAHDVTSDELGAKELPSRTSLQLTPRSAGKIAYRCTIHPGMTGTLDVTNR